MPGTIRIAGHVGAVAGSVRGGLHQCGGAGVLLDYGGGGGLLGAGLFVIAGAGIGKLRFTAIVLTGVLNLSYGLGRLVSMTLDGVPHNILVSAMGGEFVIGMLCLAVLAFGRTRDVAYA